MKNYNIYSNGSGLIAIKEGFSWPALFFGPLWGFTKGFWIWDVTNESVLEGTIHAA
jgi:hypothetical protein